MWHREKNLLRLIMVIFSVFVPPGKLVVNGLARDLHTSPEELESVFKFDKVVADALRCIPNPSVHVRKYLESYGWLSIDKQMMSEDEDVIDSYFIGHPLHVFALIKRFAVYYPHIKKDFQYITQLEGKNCTDHREECNQWKRRGHCAKTMAYMIKHCPVSCGFCGAVEKFQLVKNVEKMTVMPSARDFSIAAEAIGYLQKIYELPINDLAMGKIYDYTSSVELSQWDCLHIALEIQKMHMLSSALLWYNYVKEMSTDSEVALYVSVIIYNISEWMNSSLKCELTTRGHPFFWLQPIKQETIMYDPRMYIFHDVLRDEEIATLKSLMGGKFSRESGGERIVNAATFTKHDHKVVERIHRRSAMLTGLLPDGGTEESLKAEPFRIRFYGSGGHLHPHADCYYKHLADTSRHKNLTHGDKMSTLMYYLNDVHIGGRTAFIRLNTSVTPEKGSAVFWNNLKRNGVYDIRLEHGGCPTVLGTKMVGLRWFRENWNFRNRPCALSPHE